MLDSQGDLLEKAFQLAYFIHGDKAVATRIVTESVAKLEVAATAQDKRLYYNPTGRNPSEQSGSQQRRSKVSMDESQLLQRLVYIESEPHERRQEEKDAAYLDEEDMIIRYIKHLVKITVKRNSFYVTLGLSRLLHNYTTAETIELYGVLVQDPDRARDDHYYRSRKKVLMKELRERFSRFLKVVRGYRGEERFQSKEPNEKRLGVVEKCLRMFTPWNTDCVLNSNFDPLTDYLPQLAFAGDDPDSEHPVEMSRMHTALHPQCYARAIDGLGFEPTDERLEVPNFFLSGNANSRRPPSDRRDPPSLSREDMSAILSELGERAARRRTASAGLLSIMVDGIERARMIPASESRIRFDITEGSELLEVYSKEESGDVLLAAFLLDYDESKSNSEKSSIVLEGGQKLSFSLRLSRDDEGEVTGGVVEVLYEETYLAKAASLSWQRFGNRLATLVAPSRWTGFSPAKAALAFSVIAALALGLWFFALSGNESSKSEIAGNEPASAQTSDKESPALDPDTTPQSAIQPHQAAVPDKKSGSGDEHTAEEPPAPLPPQIAVNPRRPEIEIPSLEDSNAELTRSPESEPVARSLLGVKSIVIEAVESGPFSESFRQSLTAELRARGRFAITDDYNRADALLRVTARQPQTSEGARVGRVSVQILNAAGRSLWSAPDSGSQNRYTGETPELARRVADDLLKEIARQERNRKR